METASSVWSAHQAGKPDQELICRHVGWFMVDDSQRASLCRQGWDKAAFIVFFLLLSFLSFFNLLIYLSFFSVSFNFLQMVKFFSCFCLITSFLNDVCDQNASHSHQTSTAFAPQYLFLRTVPDTPTHTQTLRHTLTYSHTSTHTSLYAWLPLHSQPATVRHSVTSILHIHWPETISNVDLC